MVYKRLCKLYMNSSAKRGVFSMVREARLSDYPQILSLESQIFEMHIQARPDIIKPRQQPLDCEYYQKCLDDDSHKIFVWEENGDILGHCMTRKRIYENHPMFYDRTILEIEDLCVDQKARGRGIGRALFDRACAYAREIGAAHLELTVWHFNGDARRFYEHLGMREQTSRMELMIE